MSILDRIIATKLEEIEFDKGQIALPLLREQASVLGAPLSLREALTCNKRGNGPAIIAEVKLASPSRGIIRQDLIPLEIAISYARCGARAISVLTDVHYFKGSLAYLRQICSVKLGLPLLRKDFIVDPYQVWQAKVAGADALLLIAAALSDEQLLSLSLESAQAGLEVLLEIHNEEELSRALGLFLQLRNQNKQMPLPLLGINNRDLHSFVTGLAVTERISAQLHEALKKETYRGIAGDIVLVAESGISKAEDIIRLTQVGTRGFLIGESLLAEGDPGTNLKNLLSSFHSL